MSGKLDDLKEKLANLFVVDTTDRSKGIQISLPKPEPEQLAHPSPFTYQSPSPPPAPSPTPVHGIQLQNGRIVREGRHTDSAYQNWVQASGPAETELEKKAAGARARNPASLVPLQDLEYAVVDTETTGGGVGRGHRITEIAIVRVNAHGKVLHEYVTLVNPGRSIPPAITALTHITHDMVRIAPRFEDIATDVRALLQGRVFVAHNAPFDWGFVSDELIRTTGRPLYGKKLCTVRLARKVVPEVRSRSLDSLSYFFSVHNEARHRAYGDARATAIIFRRLMDRVRDREVVTWHDLEHMTLRRSQRRKRTAMPIGIEDI